MLIPSHWEFEGRPVISTRAKKTIDNLLEIHYNCYTSISIMLSRLKKMYSYWFRHRVDIGIG